MRYIRVSSGALEVTVGFKPGIGRLTIPLAPGRKHLAPIDHPIARAVLHDVLYPAVHERDQRMGRYGRSYKLVPPDPWLVALGLVMWEGIVQGLAWDTVKLSVRMALRRLRRSRVAPPAAVSGSTRRSFELGFSWVEYIKGSKQREMFVGLRRKHDEMRKLGPKAANNAPLSANVEAVEKP